MFIVSDRPDSHQAALNLDSLSFVEIDSSFQYSESGVRLVDVTLHSNEHALTICGVQPLTIIQVLKTLHSLKQESWHAPYVNLDEVRNELNKHS